MDAYRRVVANSAKCGALLERMKLLQPAIEQLAELLEAGARAYCERPPGCRVCALDGPHLRGASAGKLPNDAAAAGATAVLVRIQGNFVAATSLISAWAQRGAGFFGTLKQALVSAAFSADFDALREELVTRVADLQLYLSVRLAVDAAGWRRADADADREDRAALPAVIANEAEDGAHPPSPPSLATLPRHPPSPPSGSVRLASAAVATAAAPLRPRADVALVELLRENGMSLDGLHDALSRHDINFETARASSRARAPPAARPRRQWWQRALRRARARTGRSSRR